jgi:hypothetical protein
MSLGGWIDVLPIYLITRKSTLGCSSNPGRGGEPHYLMRRFALSCHLKGFLKGDDVRAQGVLGFAVGVATP